MKVQLSLEELNYLTTTFLKERKNPKYPITLEITMRRVDKQMAEEIRSWAIAKLEVAGFDNDYELTEEGKILEGIVDKFYM